MSGKKLIDNYEQINVADDWEQVKERLSFHESARRTLESARRTLESARRLHLWGKTAIAAAVAICLLVVGGLYYSQSTENKEIAFNQIVVPNGQKSQIFLSDGTSVWLNSGSRLDFPATFEKDVRLVKLTGEAYFEVTKNKQQPFVVQTAGMNIKVYGTRFNISSYSDEITTEVTLLSGSVSISDDWNAKEIFLKPNQKIVYEPEKHHFSQPVTVEADAATAWRNDKLIFDNEPLGKIFRKLERYYDISICIEDPEIGQQYYTGSFNQRTWELTIKALQAIEKFDYRIEKDTIYIY